MSITKRVASVALIGALGVAAVPAAANAAQTPATQSYTYNISVNKGILTNGQNVVKANVKVTNPQKNVRDFWSRSTVQQVVREGINNQYQKPYMSEGFRCTPTLDGSMNASTAKFTCKLQGADVPTTVQLTFTAPYLPPVA